MKRIIASLLLASTSSLAGCFVHRPAELESLPDGARVRATLTAGQGERMEELLGRDTRSLEGTFAGREGSSLIFQIPTETSQDGRRLTQRVIIPADAITSLDVRQLDRKNTFLIAGAATALGAALVITQFAAARDQGSDNEGGPTNEARIPLLRIPFGWE